MKKLFTPFLFLFVAHFAMAQYSLKPQVIASSGNYHVSGTYSLSYTIGEPVVASGGNINAYMLTQGFQQPNDKDVAVQQINMNNLEIKIFPNPAVDEVNIIISSDENNPQLSVKFSDLLGRSLNIPTGIYNDGNKKMYTMNVSNLAASIYFISVTDEKNNLSRTFKINKIN